MRCARALPSGFGLQVAYAGDVVAMFGVECSTMDTFTSDKDCSYAMTSMHVPQPVLRCVYSYANLRQLEGRSISTSWLGGAR